MVSDHDDKAKRDRSRAVTKFAFPQNLNRCTEPDLGLQTFGKHPALAPNQASLDLCRGEYRNAWKAQEVTHFER
jgi:hypothetical protein